MKTKIHLRFTVMAMLVIVSLMFQSGWVTSVKAGAGPKSAQEAGGNVPLPFSAIRGVPYVPDQLSKPEADIPDDSRTPMLDLPPLPPDPDKGPVDETPPTRDRSYWTVTMSENFEGVFPSGLWNVFDNNGATTYGEYYWDDDDYKPHPPTPSSYWSAWVANGGANGVDPATNNYANNMDSWMMYGPFDLSGCAAADFEFFYWNKSESNYDFFGWGASPNGSNLYGSQLSGSQESWNYVDFDLAPYLGDTSVWLAFVFRSDSSVTDIGTFVDDVNLWCLTETNVKSWTYMVYLDGDNNLEAAAVDDFMEMSSVGSSASVNVVALMDRISGYDTNYDDWTDTRRFYITAGMQPLAANGVSWGEANMGDPETLLKFVRWAKAAYPANHYVLVFWDHGSGWRLRDPNDVLTKAVSYDDTSGGDAIDMPELRNSLSTLTSNGAYPIDIVGMDACLMGMIEVDNQIKPYATIRVGSEENEPADGWPYNTILSALVANPAMSAATLATNIVDFYYSSYGNNNTQSAVNLGSPFTTLNTAVNNLAVALTNNGANYISQIQLARNYSTQFAYTYYIDLWDFADYIRMYVSDPTINNAAIAVENAVTAAVIHEHHGGTWPWARGISIYFPKTPGEYDARYDGSTGFLQFTATTQWDEWIHTYHNFANYPAMFNKSGPANGATGQLFSLPFSWDSSAGATGYDICAFDTSNDNVCNGGGSWFNMGTGTSVTVGGLNEATTYYWQVRARNASGTVYANNGTWWSFTTGSLPTAFNKSGPANGATNQSLSPTLTWGASTGATSYEYCYDTSNDNACSGWTSNGASTSKALSGLSQNTTYYWHVRALNTYGTRYSNGTSTAFWSFTTGGVPGIFNKSSPSSGATNQPLNLSLSWGASSNVTGYEYCYDTSNDNVCSSWTNVGNVTSTPLSGLSQYTTYYWHIRANNSFGTTYSNGSSTTFWSFTTGGVPGAFNKSSPANGTTNQPSSLTLNWNSSSNATAYEYCYDASNNNICDGSWINNGSSTSVPISGLNLGTTYYWQVRANNSFGITYSNDNLWWSFATGNPPGAFNKSNPANGATGQLTSLTLQWGASTYATSYEYCYDTTNNAACDGSWIGNGSSTSVPINGLSQGTIYYWQVRAVNGFSTTYANGGSWWSFTTGSMPGSFNKIDPWNGTTNLTASPTLSWGASSGAASYEYCYDTSNDNVCSGWTSNGTSTSKSLSGLSQYTTYYWHVRAINTFGTTYADGNSTTFWSFTTGGVPGAFNKNSPANGATNQSTSPMLTWNASTNFTNYEYCYDTSNNNVCDGSWINNGTNTSVSLGSLSSGTTYYWQVRAANSFGMTFANGNIWWSFMTGNAPGAFNKSNPGNGAVNQPTNLNMQWSASSNVTNYEYCYDTVNNNTCDESWVDNGVSTSVPITGLNMGMSYYWQVRANNGFGTTYSNGNVWWSFTIGNVPGAFNKSTPANGAIDQSTNPILSWGASSGAVSYAYCYDMTNDNACDGAWINNGVVTNAQLNGLSTATTYYWYVKAINPFGETGADGDLWWYFSTGNISTQIDTFYTAGSFDGWILESTETSGVGGALNTTATTFNLGDDAVNKQYRSILSFSTKDLPDNAVITKVTLKVRKQGIIGGGNPVTTFQGFMADIRKGFFGTTTGLVNSDFQAVASKSNGPYKPALVSGWYSINMTSAKAYINKLTTGGGLTQIRLRFMLDDNNNFVANYLKLYSGNAVEANRPQLVIEYYVP